MSVIPQLCYFICCTPRSGSFLLAEALTNTGLAGTPGEHFNHRIQGWHPEFTADDFRSALQPVYNSGTAGGVFGTKVMWPPFSDFVGKLEQLAQRDGATLPEIMAQVFPNPHYIMLTRRDKVRQTISFGRAWWTNVWRSTQADSQRGRVEDLELDPEVVDLRMREIKDNEVQFQRYFTRYGIQPFKVVYEDLVERYEETALQALDFLGIPHPPDLAFGPRRLERQWDAASDELLRRYYAAKGIQPLHPIS